MGELVQGTVIHRFQGAGPISGWHGVGERGKLGLVVHGDSDGHRHIGDW
jgi:hypothetical protein